MSTDIVRYEEAPSPAPMNLFGAADPADVIAKASHIAAVLKDVLKRQGLVTKIGPKEFVNVEGWTLLGSMLGVFPVVEWTKPVLDIDGNTVGWEARVMAQTRLGEIVGAAEAMCLKTERFGRGKDEYAIRAMAQTRATSRAMRGPLGFVVVLAGYESVAPEEMPPEDVAGGAGTTPAHSVRPVPEVRQGAEVLSPPPATNVEPMSTAAHWQRLGMLEARMGIDHEEAHDLAGVDSYKELTAADAEMLIRLWTDHAVRREEVSGQDDATDDTSEEAVAEVVPFPVDGEAAERGTSDAIASEDDIEAVIVACGSRAKALARAHATYGVRYLAELTKEQAFAMVVMT